MDIGLLSLLRNPVVDFHRGLASSYAQALKNAFALHVDGAEKNKDKQRGFFLSQKRGLEDKLYVGNIHRIEGHLYWKDEELADDDQIVNVVMMVGPVTRDGGACSYGTKDMRDQVLYANSVPQVVGHIFYINTPGGESSCRNDYEAIIDSCRNSGKPVVAFVDGLCASSGVNFASRADRVIVMNPHDEFGCIGSMAAFWATPDGAIDRDGTRYVEIVGEDCPEKNDWWREAAKGDYEKLQALINKSTKDFHQSVRDNRPLVKDTMLTGDIFEAQELIPELVDEVGDFNRAIECVFALAEKKMQPARLAVPEPDGNEGGEGGEQEEMAKLSEQQKAAVNTSRGDTMIVDNGHVKTTVSTMFGEEEKEIANPKKDMNMATEENKLKEEAAAAEAPQDTENTAPENGGEKAEEGAAPENGGEKTEEGAAPENGGEKAEEGAAPENGGEKTEEGTAPENGGEKAEEGTAPENGGEKAEEGAAPENGGEKTEEGAAPENGGEKTEEGAAPENGGEKTEEGAAPENGGEKAEEGAAQAELAKTTDALHTAEALIAEKDKALAERDKTIEKYTETISELKASNEKLTQQVTALKAEIKELSEKEAPMVTEDGGVPADNGAGGAPKKETPLRITAEMSYEEIRAVKKAEREAAKAKK